MAEELSTSSDHVPNVKTGESDGLQVSRRLDAASCKLSFLIAVWWNVKLNQRM